MKISAITAGMNHNLPKPAFKGVWGEKKFLKNDGGDDIVCDYFELKYHPFFEEKDEDIRKIIKNKNKELNSIEKGNGFYGLPDIPEMTIYCEHTKISRGKKLKLTTLDCEQLAEAYEMKMPETLEEYSKLIKKVKNLKKIIK